MSWFNVSEHVEAADGREAAVEAIAFPDGEQVVQVQYCDGKRAGWLWAIQFRKGDGE